MPNEWRKTSEGLPELPSHVWACDYQGRREIVHSHALLNYPKTYTHWMPIETPEPPKKEGE